MDPVIGKYLSGLEIGDLQQHKNMAVFPLSISVNGGPDYWTLKEALEKTLFVVTEVSESGSVPNLKVTNKAEISVLLLDGEELSGAKQNRVLNTTILVKEKSEVVIPVSCTEQGRWSYAAREFRDSDTVMSPKLRSAKSRDVATSLESSREFRSDQGTVWTGIHQMAADTRVSSRTGAMKDVFEAKKAELDAYLNAFVCLPQQRGLIVFIGGEVVGFDFISRPQAFSGLFPKLVKSYAMEALLEEQKKEATKADGGGEPASGAESPAPAKEKARVFIDEATACEEKRYESVGRGYDYRFTGKEMVGSALAVEDKVIHMAFFRITEAEKAGGMASTSRRRGFRV
jgi:hypothetical protein